MTSILSFPMSDPFAPSSSRSPADDSAARYPTPPFPPASHQFSSLPATQRAAGTTMTQTARISSSGPPLPNPSLSDAIGSNFSTAPSPSMPDSSGNASTMTLPLHVQDSLGSSSSSSSPQGVSASAAARKRQSHNPAMTLIEASPPKAEHLTDEYVLHPSVSAYKQAHPRRPMIGFGPYILLQTLGEGEFGKVKLGVHTEYGVEVAIKLIRRGSLEDEARASKVEREIDVLKSLRHPNIVRMFDVIDTDKYIGIVLEFAGGGELFDYILANRFLKEKDAARLFAQLISGVDYLHRKHIVHRDLKLENLLLDKHRNVIITDFGFANRFEHEQDDLMATSCGSPCYAAPELVVSEGLYVGSAVDIWSCGVILYAMLSGYLPYDDDPANPEGDNINLLYKYIMSTPLNFPDHMSRLAMNLLLMMLVPNPLERCTINQIMVHPWLEAHRELFIRSVEKNEEIFTESMYRKSQQAKRELSERRRYQQEAKLAKAQQRSQSTAAGTGSASLLDSNRRVREQRHRSALPGTTTMPDYLFNAGVRTEPVPKSTAQFSPALQYKSDIDTGSPMTIPVPNISIPVSLVESPPRPHSVPLAPLAPLEVQNETNDLELPLTTDSTSAVENLFAEVVQSGSQPVKQPMSTNKNRHTIQVEYDGEASWERMKATFATEGGKSETGTETPVGESITSPQTPMLVVPEVNSDIEMESSSELGHSVEGTLDSPGHAAVGLGIIDTIPVPADVAIPSATASTPALMETASHLSTEPSTPSKRSRDADTEATSDRFSPVTPKASMIEELVVTPRATVDSTPKASVQSVGKHQATTPTKQPSTSKSPSDLKQFPPPTMKIAQAKREGRSRKGMSLDKFGLARLLGQASASSTTTTANAKSPETQEKARASLSRPPTVELDKKTRRKTLQLMVNRATPAREELSAVPATAPLTQRDMNPIAAPRSKNSPPVIVGRQGIQPQASHDRGQSTPSIVTVDAFATRQINAPGQRTASSSAAKKVMDWFRRKSLAKETLTSFRAAGIRTDSNSSFVHVPGTILVSEMGLSAQPESVDTIAMSSTSSVGHGDASPTIIINTEQETTRKQPTVGQGPIRAKTISSPSRPPVTFVANTDLKSAPNLLSPEPSASLLLPDRSQSHHRPSTSTGMQAITPTSVNNSTITTAGLQKSRHSPGLLMTSSVEENKMRVHTGLVDQAALSSRPPQEVMVEVVRVLQAMGMDIKKEADYRLRCTRVRRRKAGATTSLGLSSVITTGSGLSPFTLMSSASASRTDSRGLPLPSSPSGSSLLSPSGLKGMILRRGSSYSAHPATLVRSESDLLGSPSASTPGLIASPILGPLVEPLYGEHSIDNGDEVKFVVELCRIKNLHGLYLLSIKRLRGSVWSFKFIYQTVLERCDTLTH